MGKYWAIKSASNVLRSTLYAASISTSAISLMAMAESVNPAVADAQSATKSVIDKHVAGKHATDKQTAAKTDIKSHVNAKAESEASTLLMKKLARYNTLQGRFQQTLIEKSGKVIQTTEGAFSLKRPGLYRWLSDEPYPQEVVGNGQTIWVYDPDLEQVTVTPQSRMPFNPAVLLSGSFGSFDEHFTVEHKQGEGNDNFELMPLPKHPAAGASAFSSLTLGFVNDAISQVAFSDQLGQKTRIQFLNVKPNQPLDNAAFEFVVPEGADVLVNE